MYGFPLTIYLLSGWLGSRYPGIDFMSHDAGHLLEVLFGWRTNPHFGPFHIRSNILIIGGFFLWSVAWKVLYAAQRQYQLATTGPHQHIRHPQYAAFILIMVGFLLQWPTLVTLLMFPVLIMMSCIWRDGRNARLPPNSVTNTSAMPSARRRSFRAFCHGFEWARDAGEDETGRVACEAADCGTDKCMMEPVY